MTGKLTILSKIILLLLFLPTQIMAKVEVTVSKNPALLNEAFDIRFVADFKVQSRPDFSPLNSNFEIFNQSQKTQLSIINGRTTQKSEWILKVMPKKVGNILIPAIKFDQDYSLAGQITVVSSPKGTVVKDLFVETEVDNKTPLVQQQVIYTMRLFTTKSSLQVQIPVLNIENSIVEQLGNDKKHSINRGSTRYTVLERKYAVFPEKSGKITIAPLTINTAVLVKNARGIGGFLSNNYTDRKRISSSSIVLDVKPIPQSFTFSHWIASKKVDISQKWSSNAVKIGEPITRTITVKAVANNASQLPELDFPATSIKNYVEEPVIKNQSIAGDLVATKIVKIAYIANQAGEYHIQPIEFSWFNTKTNKIEVAKTASYAINVLANNTSEISTKPLTTQEQSPPQSNWMWLTIAFGLIWLLTVVLFLWYKNRPSTAKDKATDNDKFKLNHIKQACLRDDADAANKAILSWGKIKFNALNLADIAKYCDDDLAQEINKLNVFIYSESETKWSGKELLQAFKNFKPKQVKKNAIVDTLEPLNKIN